MRLGLTRDHALAAVAIHYGLSVNVVKLTPDGKGKPIDMKWTLKEIEHLLFLQAMATVGRIGGPER